tara:strand:+ start:5810 stop:5929 length:120 start_codon:yes stop_codon:yes gene_type:complete
MLSEDQNGKAVAESHKGPINIQVHLVEKKFVSIYSSYSS